MTNKALHILGGWAYPADFLQPLAAELSERFDVTMHPFTFEHSSFHPSSPYVLAGWSLGALYALQHTVVSRIKPDALVLISGTARFCACDNYMCGTDRALLKSMQAGMRRNRQKTLSMFYQIAEERGAPVYDNDPNFTDDELCRGLKDLETLDLRNSLSEITTPALLLHGEKDRVIPCDAAKYLAHKLPAGRLITHPEAGHDLPHRHPTWLAETILASLEGQAPACP